MTFRACVLALLLLLVGGMPVAAQDATPDPANLPHATAPFDLGGVVMPASPEAVEALFDLLPGSIDGQRQQPWITGGDRTQVPYGEAMALGHPMVLGAISFAEGDFFPPDFTAGDYVALSLATDELENVAGGREGDIAWIQGEVIVSMGVERTGTPAASQAMHTLAWGELDGGWIFTAIADSPDRLEALVAAFVQSAGGPVATPAA